MKEFRSSTVLRAEQEEVLRNERMEKYERLRKEAIQAIEAVHGKNNPDALPLAEVVRLMPDHPEWNIFRAKKFRRKKQ